jgi:uncharacterized protein YjbI with pentapeptide repeats
MSHRSRSLGLLAVLCVLGCDSAPDPACDVVVQSFRSLMQNGSSINGLSLNGTSFNGVGLNGKGLNGKGINGKGPNGISVNGQGMQGIALNGASLNGVALEGVVLEGTSLRATDSEGRVLEGTDLIGTALLARVADRRVTVRIDSVAIDPVDPSLHFYGLTHEGESICGGDENGLFVRGVWDESGARRESLSDDPSMTFTFSCASGAIAKCIGWGYVPDTVGVDAHQTCTRLARADYCGDGLPHTVDGTLVDVYDTLGVMQRELGSDLEFEAGWGPDGATCMSRPRYVERDVDGSEIAIPCRDALPVCDSADEAIALGATVVNDSAPQTMCHAR